MKSVLLFCLLFLFTGQLAPHAQAFTGSADSTTLQGQYQTVLRRSKNEGDFKRINPDRLNLVWKNVTDSFSAERKKMSELQVAATSQRRKLNRQAVQLDQQQKALEASQNRIDRVNFLGYPIDKLLYHAVTWGLIVSLALALTFLIIRSSGYRKEARYRVQLYEELTEDYHSFKIRTNEKEKKLARELQDERNKLEELTQSNDIKDAKIAHAQQPAVKKATKKKG